MQTVIIKKDAAKEPWSEEKLRNSIRAAAQDAGVDEERTKAVTNSVVEKVLDNIDDEKEVTSYRLRNVVLRELENMESGIADAWRKYELTK
ncbi:MAG: ATP cone domain-containing protein [Candidatus Colwellbacteria bacterium]|nr:ATP cone domain-containing protein [Candidatus Colwellbacteria bacterium]